MNIFQIILYIARPFSHFHVVYAAVVDVETDGSADLMEALYACRTGIDGQHIVFTVIDYPEDVGVSAYEDVRKMGINQLEGLVVIPSREAPYVHHQNLLALAFEELGVGYS